MTWRPPAILLARVVNGVFFLTTSAYCLLSYSSFAYYEFIRTEVFAWLSAFVILHHVLFWVVTVITALTLVPEVQRPRARWFIISYLAASAAVGVWLVEAPFLATVDNSGRSLVAGLATLVLPIWLAVIDHRDAGAAPLRESSEERALWTSGVTALVVWTIYALLAPLRLRMSPGIDLTFHGFVIAWIASALSHLVIFAALFLLLAIISGVARAMHTAALEYWLLVGASAGAIALILFRLAFAAIALGGPSAACAAVSLGVTIALAWSGVARHYGAAWRGPAPEPLELLLAPIGVAGSRALAILCWIALPLIAYVLPNALDRFDWDFLLQKLSVLIVWLIAFALVHALTTSRSSRASWAGVSAPLAVLTASWAFAFLAPAIAARGADARLNPEFLSDQYAALDPSFHFIRDASRSNSGKAAAFYAYLKANSTISHVTVQPIDIDFVRPLAPPRAAPPNIFLLIVDSMRRDYVSPYNPAVTFTPAIGAFAKESFVFERVFTRYGATGLSVPAIWAGGMLLHMQYVRPFDRMNSLAKLLDAAGYRRIMSRDAIVGQLVPVTAASTELDRGKKNVDFDVCSTLTELESDITATRGDARPIFGYSLPQNVHIANSFTKPVSPGASFPGFFTPVAVRVQQVDACFGRFIDYLKRENLYDKSIVVLMSDHGDSLGEDGRWGHAYTVFPEVMRIPLIIHVPTEMSDKAADLGRVSFSTDVAPTLYSLLGYTPADLGPFYGTPLLRPADAADDRGTRDRRRESVLLTSSYGAVYGMLRHDGRELYIADAVEGRDYAYDLADGGAGHRIEITQAMRDLNWRLIHDQVAAVTGQYSISRQP